MRTLLDDLDIVHQTQVRTLLFLLSESVRNRCPDIPVSNVSEAADRVLIHAAAKYKGRLSAEGDTIHDWVAESIPLTAEPLEGSTLESQFDAIISDVCSHGDSVISAWAAAVAYKTAAYRAHAIIAAASEEESVSNFLEFMPIIEGVGQADPNAAEPLVWHANSPVFASLPPELRAQVEIELDRIAERLMRLGITSIRVDTQEFLRCTGVDPKDSPAGTAVKLRWAELAALKLQGDVRSEARTGNGLGTVYEEM